MYTTQNVPENHFGINLFVFFFLANHQTLTALFEGHFVLHTKLWPLVLKKHPEIERQHQRS